jgi:hypothetical protein
MKIRQAIQIGDNVTDIMRLPCIKKCVKRNDRHGMEWLEYWTTDGDIVESGDWLCETDEGKWLCMSDEEYKSKMTL